MGARPLTPRPYAHISTEQLKQQQEQFKDKDQFHESLIADELLRRENETNIKAMINDIKALKKPHWTLVPIFWLTFATLLVSILAYLWPLQPDFRAVKSNVQHEPSKKVISSGQTLTGTSQKSKPMGSQRKPSP